MATMTDAPYVHHVPTITGGNGTAGVRDFYGHHFIGQWPDDTETRQVSRTVGETQVPVIPTLRRAATLAPHLRPPRRRFGSWPARIVAGWGEAAKRTIRKGTKRPVPGKASAIVPRMETPAEYFSKNKASHQQALKMLGHPVSQASRSSKSSTSASTKTRASRSASSSISRHRSRAV